MTDIKQLAKNLRRYNAWRRDEDPSLKMPNMKDLGEWIEEAANALDCLTEPEPIKCETCEGAGKIDERLGGYHTSNANAQCPDCDGAGYLESIHDFRPGQWWVKELDGIQASQEATPDQKRAVAVVHNLLRHITKLERTERTASASEATTPVVIADVIMQAITKDAQTEEALTSNPLAPRVENPQVKELIERLREYADNNGYSHGDYADSLKQAAREIENLEADRDALAAELEALREQDPVSPDLLESARAVVARWDAPTWKDFPATAEYIGRLRAAIAQADLDGALTAEEWVVKNVSGSPGLVRAMVIRAEVAESAIETPAKVSPCAGHAVQQDADEAKICATCRFLTKNGGCQSKGTSYNCVDYCQWEANESGGA